MRRALPYILLLITLLGSAGGGLAGAAINRHEHRQEVAAAKARAEAQRLADDAAYRTAVIPVVREVADLTKAAALAEALDVRSRNDVAATVPFAPAAQRAAATLRGATAPADLVQDEQVLTQALDGLVQGALAVNEGGRAARRTGRPSGLVDQGFDALASSGADFDAAAASLIGETLGFADDEQVLRNKAQFLIDLDATCSSGAAALVKVDFTTSKQFLAKGDRFATTVAGTVTDLRRQLSNHPEALTLRQSLAKIPVFTDAVHEVIRAVHAQNRSRGLAAVHRLQSAVDAFAPVSSGFGALGSSWCQAYFSDGKKKATGVSA